MIKKLLLLLIVIGAYIYVVTTDNKTITSHIKTFQKKVSSYLKEKEVEVYINKWDGKKIIISQDDVTEHKAIRRLRKF